MKKQIAQNLTRVFTNKALPLFLLMFSLNLLPMLAISQGNNEKPAVVKYMGTVNDQVVFQLTYDNKEGEPFYLTVKDAEGNILYTAKYNEKNFSKQFRFDKDEFSNASVSFTLAPQNEKESQTFKVATSSRVVENIVVTKL
ncbi:MAG: hypothetical protein ACXVMS_03535 [Flavisolibacter sp.]